MDSATMTRPKPSPLLRPLSVTRDVYLSVIVPAYNEEKRLPKTLASISEYLERQSYNYEVLVVSSKSTDNTVGLVRQLQGSIPHVDVLDLKENLGKGYAVGQGMLHTAGRIRLFMDADNATDISHFDVMRPLFDEGYEVVICSRDGKDAEGATQAVTQPFHKRLLGNLGNLFIQLVAVRGIWDTQCGFKAFRNFAAERIFSEVRIHGFGFDIEVLALARFFGYRIGIVPAHWINDPHTKVTLLTYVKVLWETIVVAWNMKKSAYGKNHTVHES